MGVGRRGQFERTGSTGLGGEQVREMREKGSRPKPRKLARVGWTGLPLSVVGSTGKKQVMESSVRKTVVRPAEPPGDAVS